MLESGTSRALSRVREGVDARKLAAGGLLAAAVVFPLVVRQPYILHLAIMGGLYTILTLSLNIVAGYLGLLHLGHAAFYGIGAYVATLLTLDVFHGAWYSFWIGLPLAGLAGFASGALLGIPTMRVRGDYLAIVTLGFGEIVRFVLINWEEVTRGPIGIAGIPPPQLFGFSFSAKPAYYYLVLAFVLLTVYPIVAWRRGPVGRAWIAIREDEVAAAAMGVPTTLYKILGFAISACYAAIAGALFAHYASYIHPLNFSGWESIGILIMLTVGGRGTIAGAIVGAIVLTVVPELFRGFVQYRQLVYGAAMVVLMIFRPRGLVGDQGI